MKSTSSTLSALLRAHAEQQPHATAVLAPGRAAMTYGALWQQLQDVGAALTSRGVTPSTRVAVALPNGPEMAAAFLGVAACAVCAPLNPAYRPRNSASTWRTRAPSSLSSARATAAPARVAKEMNLTLSRSRSTRASAGQFTWDSPPRRGPARVLFGAARRRADPAHLGHDRAAEDRAAQPRQSDGVGGQHRALAGAAAPAIAA